MDPAAAVSALAQQSSLVGYAVLVVLSILSTWAMLWKTSKDQTHQLRLIELNHKLDAADRREQAAIEKAERDAAAANIRQQLVNETSSLQTNVKDDTRLVLALQTADLKAAIDSAKGFMADKAEAAFDAANDVNSKLRVLSEAHQRQGAVLERLLTEIARTSDFPRAAKRVDDPPGAIIGRRATDAPGVVIPKRPAANHD